VTAQEPYPGARLGLPESGPGSVATFPRRLVAIVIYWGLCQLIAYAALGVRWGMTGAQAAFAPLGIFALESVLLVSLLGSTLGHRVMGLRVHRLTDSIVATPGGLSRLAGPPGLGRGALRTLLLCLALPALVWDADNRGMHDKAAGTVIVRSR